MCTVTLNGKGDLRGLKIDKSLVDPEDVEVLEDLIVAAFNDAKAKADEASKEKMSEVTGGLKLPPGLNLPF
jgi:DNA-binding YbaB/EbfC family protein